MTSAELRAWADELRAASAQRFNGTWPRGSKKNRERAAWLRGLAMAMDGAGSQPQPAMDAQAQDDSQ